MAEVTLTGAGLTTAPEVEALSEKNIKRHGAEIDNMYKAILGVMALLTAWSMWVEFGGIATESLGVWLGGILALLLSIGVPAFLEVGVIGWWAAREHPSSNSSQRQIARTMTNRHIAASIGILLLNLLKVGVMQTYNVIAVDGEPILSSIFSEGGFLLVANAIFAVVIALMAFWNITHRRDFREHDDKIQREREYARQVEFARSEITRTVLGAQAHEAMTELAMLKQTIQTVATANGIRKAMDALIKMGVSEDEARRMLSGVRDVDIPSFEIEPEPEPVPGTGGSIADYLPPFLKKMLERSDANANP